MSGINKLSLLFGFNAAKQNKITPFNSMGQYASGVKPLEKDTVSFGKKPEEVRSNHIPRDKGKDLEGKDKLGSSNAARAALKSVKEAGCKDELQTIVDDIVSRMPEGSVALMPKVKFKKVYSLREKMGQNSKQIKNAEGVRQNITDVVRTKIVLSNGSNKDVNAFTQAIMEVIKKANANYYGRDDDSPKTDRDAKVYNNKFNKYGIKITEIERIYPLSQGKEKEGRYSYFNDKQQGAVAGLMRDVHLKQTFRPYSAVHILFELGNPEKPYIGELQIVGANVNDIKEVEDVFYKICHNKEVEKELKPVAEKFKYLKDNDEFIEAYKNYIDEAYKIARNLEIKGIKMEVEDFPKSFAAINSDICLENLIEPVREAKEKIALREEEEEKRAQELEEQKRQKKLTADENQRAIIQYPYPQLPGIIKSVRANRQ